MVGQWLGANAAARIDRLVLANTAPFMGPPAAWQERIKCVLQEGMGAIAEGVIERWFTPEFAAAAPDVVAAIIAAVENSGVKLIEQPVRRAHERALPFRREVSI